MSEVLLPCPFCGGEASHTVSRDKVGCFKVKCGALIARPDWRNAIAAWNRRASGWVSVEERLPEDYKPVIVPGGVGFVVDGVWRTFLERTHTGDCAVIQWKVTHWQPLPAPPEASS